MRESGQDLDDGGGARGGGAVARREPQWQARGWHGPRWRARGWPGHRRWRRRGIEVHVEEEWSVRRPRGGGRRGVEADTEEERAPMGVWWGNDRVMV
jgi:hypothetical protein